MRIRDGSSDVCSSDLECDKLRPRAPFSPLARIRSRYRLPAATRSRFGPGLVHVRPYLVRPFVEGIARRLRRAQQLCNGCFCAQLRPRFSQAFLDEIGRASCQERGGQYVEISVSDVPYTTKKKL